MTKYKLIAFDADDTLWDCQSHFVNIEEKYASLLSDYGIAPDEVKKNLFATECANMPLLGFGVKAFMLSLIENANRMTEGRIGGKGIDRIMELGRQLLTFDPNPLDGVEEVLTDLSDHSDLKLAVNDKTPDAVRALCRLAGVKPDDLLMVGNSFKSDVEPTIATGASAVYIPTHHTWEYEKTEEYAHTRVTKISNIRELLQIV